MRWSLKLFFLSFFLGTASLGFFFFWEGLKTFSAENLVIKIEPEEELEINKEVPLLLSLKNVSNVEFRDIRVYLRVERGGYFPEKEDFYQVTLERLQPQGEKKVKIPFKVLGKEGERVLLRGEALFVPENLRAEYQRDITFLSSPLRSPWSFSASLPSEVFSYQIAKMAVRAYSFQKESTGEMILEVSVSEPGRVLEDNRQEFSLGAFGSWQKEIRIWWPQPGTYEVMLSWRLKSGEREVVVKETKKKITVKESGFSLSCPASPLFVSYAFSGNQEMNKLEIPFSFPSPERVSSLRLSLESDLPLPVNEVFLESSLQRVSFLSTKVWEKKGSRYRTEYRTENIPVSDKGQIVMLIGDPLPESFVSQQVVNPILDIKITVGEEYYLPCEVKVMGPKMVRIGYLPGMNEGERLLVYSFSSYITPAEDIVVRSRLFPGLTLKECVGQFKKESLKINGQDFSFVVDRLDPYEGVLRGGKLVLCSVRGFGNILQEVRVEGRDGFTKEMVEFRIEGNSEELFIDLPSLP